MVKDGKVVSTPPGKTVWVDLELPENTEKTLMEDLEKVFKDHYTVSLKNYPVEDAYLPNSQPVKLQWRS